MCSFLYFHFLDCEVALRWKKNRQPLPLDDIASMKIQNVTQTSISPTLVSLSTSWIHLFYSAFAVMSADNEPPQCITLCTFSHIYPPSSCNFPALYPSFEQKKKVNILWCSEKWFIANGIHSWLSPSHGKSWKLIFRWQCRFMALESDENNHRKIVFHNSARQIT